MKIAIASGKGGTGKTTVAVNLAYFKGIDLLDLDVEEPNDYIFFTDSELESEVKPENAGEPVYRLVPQVIEDKCTYCGVCKDVCEFNAIIVTEDSVLIFPQLCHSCGACSYFCPEEAIIEVKREIGRIVKLKGEAKGRSIDLTYGSLTIGEASPVPLIKEVKKRANRDAILDCPPGTSCSMVEGVIDSDFVILVAEPTPFGYHNMNISIEVLTNLDKKFGIVLNKYEEDWSYREVEKLCIEKNIPVLGKIPFSRDIATKYSRGELLYEYGEVFDDIYSNVMSYA
ncbi:MAG: 4Fe-4S binding protein [Halobacteriota archaeon]